MPINGLKLPDSLVNAVQNGNWKEPSDQSFWFNLVKKEQVVQPKLYTLRAHDEPYEMWAANAGDDFLGVRGRGADPGDIDPTMAVMIGEFGPERFIVLDYRVSMKNPTVCAFLPEEEMETCWVKICENIDQFMQKLNLV